MYKESDIKKQRIFLQKDNKKQRKVKKILILINNN